MISIDSITMFNPEQYEHEVEVNLTSQTDLFSAFFIIDSNASIAYLSFDIVDNMMAGEAESVGDFLINGTSPPVVISPPFESMYQLTLSTGRDFDVMELREDIKFNLFGFVNTTDGDVVASLANVTLYKRGNHTISIIVCTFIWAYIYSAMLANGLTNFACFGKFTCWLKTLKSFANIYGEK